MIEFNYQGELKQGELKGISFAAEPACAANTFPRLAVQAYLSAPQPGRWRTGQWYFAFMN